MKMKSVLVKVFVVITVISIFFMFLDATNSINIKLGGDWIGYWGGMISAAVSIIGIYWTLYDNRKILEEENQTRIEDEKEHNRKSVYPLLEAGYTICKAKDSNFKEDESSHFKIKDDGGIDFISADIKSSYSDKRIDVYKVRFTEKHPENPFYLAFKIKNSGLGTALIDNVSYKIYESMSDYKEKKTPLSEYSSDNNPDYNGVILMISAPDSEVYGKWLSLVLEWKDELKTPGTIIAVTLSYKDLYENIYKVDKIIEVKEGLTIYGHKNRKPKLYEGEVSDS